MKIHSVVKDTALAVICLLLVIPIIIYGFPFLVGADGSYTVMSGSMSPALRSGDLVIVRKTEPYAIDIGDVVTVESGDFTYTHRVVEVLDGDRFRLKGDANEDPDLGLIEASQIIGKVILIFPFGHLYTPYGFAAALLAPAALIIGKQMHKIYQHTKRRNRRETMRFRRKSRRSPMVGTATLLLGLILVVSITRVIAPHFIGGSSSFFSDIESAGGLLRAATWKVESRIKCHVSPSSIEFGKSTIIHVNLKPPRSAEVTIENSTDGEYWTVLTTLTSNPGGVCKYEWTPEKVGSYEIRASWKGDNSYFKASSGIVTLSVKEQPEIVTMSVEEPPEGGT